MGGKFRLLAAAVLAGAGTTFSGSPTLQAQIYTPGYSDAPPVVAVNQPDAPPVMTANQLDALTGPIALYPDPLLAMLLPAATYPDDIAAAAQWLATNPQPSEDAINAQPWDPSVKAVVHYPTVLQQMASNPEWTQALGAAFVNQQQDVMDSIQRLRAAALATGTLASTPQQLVQSNDGEIDILPAEPQVIYVPVYDPQVVYETPTPLSFGVALPIGGWLNFGFDWGHHWVTRDRNWLRYRPGHRFEPRPDIVVHPWVRDDRRPAPRLPPRYAPPRVVRPVVRPGYERPTPGRPTPGVFGSAQPRPEVDRERQRGIESNPGLARPAPAHPEPVRPAPAPIAPRPAPQPRAALPQPPIAPPPHVAAPHPPMVAPQPRVITPPPPHVVPPQPPAPHVAAPPAHAAPPPPPPHVAAPPPHAAPPPPPHVSAPAPHVVAPAPHPAPAPAFRPSNGSDVQAQSDRGHQSTHR